jgi:DNA-binding CsgD family transcriptional regulator
MRMDLDAQTYTHDLEDHLQVTLFGGGGTDPEAAVLLVRGALTSGEQTRATRLAQETTRLAETNPADPDMAAAALHVRGLVRHDPAALDSATATYRAPLARAWAAEDAGIAWAERGNQPNAVARLRQAHSLYEQLGKAGGMERVRSLLRAEGTRLRHWSPEDRPAFGWASLTGTERRIVDLVAEGLSNRQVAGEMFLSMHTVAFHLRRIFWKLNVSSRVQLARLDAERVT